jgi:hypothetical protein
VLDLLALGKDLGGEAEVEASQHHVVEALDIAGVAIMADQGYGLLFQFARQIVVVEQDAVLERLMPALDPALRLRMIRRAAHVAHALVGKPFRQGPR